MSAAHATRILAIRHGETAWNTESRIQGHSDIPLNDTGLWQADRVARALHDERLQAVYSSELLRARAAAEAIADARAPFEEGFPRSFEESLEERPHA